MTTIARLRLAQFMTVLAIVLLLIQVGGMFMDPRPAWTRGSVIPAVVLVVVAAALRRRAARP